MLGELGTFQLYEFPVTLDAKLKAEVTKIAQELGKSGSKGVLV